MSSLRPLLFAAFASVVALGCPASEPAPPPKTAVRPPTEQDAKEALDAAKKKNDPDGLIAVFNKYSSFPSGKTALRLGVRKLLETALDAAERCDEPKAAGALARVAPYTTDDPEIDEAYDETREGVSRERKRCLLVKVDADVKKAEAEWDWPRAFSRISSEKEADGAALKKRRLEATARYRAWLDETLKQIVAKRSLSAVVGDKRENFDASVDAANLPPEVAPEVDKRAATIAGVRLVFDKLENGEALDPPVRWWTFGAAKVRKPEAPAAEGPVMAQGLAFHAVAKGKINGVTLLAVGSNEGTVLERLGTIKLLVPEADARTWDTRIALPEKLVGARVLAPIAPNSAILTPSVVLIEAPNGMVVVSPLAKKGFKVAAKKKDLRGLAMGPGQKVTVMIGLVGKPGELADAPEEDRVLVRVSGFESYVPIGDIRVNRADMPAPPAE